MKLNRLVKQRMKQGKASKIPMTVHSYNLAHTRSTSFMKVPTDSILKQKQGKTESVGPIRGSHTSLDLSKDLEKQLMSKKSGASTIEAVFSSIVQNDKTFGKIISKISDFYSSQLQAHQPAALKKHKQKLEAEMLECSKKREAEKEEMEVLKKRKEKYAGENEDLVNSVKDKKEKLKDMQEQLDQITSQDISYIPQTDEIWVSLKEQIKELSDACKATKKEFREQRTKEKKLVKLVLALKKRGIPVEDIYEADVQNQGKKKMKKKKSYVCLDAPTDQYQEEDNTERLPLVEGPPVHVQRPNIVPALDLEENVYESSESSESDEKSESQESHYKNPARSF